MTKLKITDIRSSYVRRTTQILIEKFEKVARSTAIEAIERSQEVKLPTGVAKDAYEIEMNRMSLVDHLIKYLDTQIEDFSKYYKLDVHTDFSIIVKRK